MKYNFITEPKTVTIITPTTGSPKLADAIVSVTNQTYKHHRHLIVVDGPEFRDNMITNIDSRLIEHTGVEVQILPDNTGGNGFYGHRIYAAFPHLLNSDYIFFLDQDNWYEPDHVESLVAVLEQGNEYAYSLRKIFDDDRHFICEDNCEAIGKWPIYFSEDQHLIDTSAFAFRREFITQTSHLWHSGWGGDRRYYSFVKDMPHDTNGKHTLCYRLAGNEGSVDASLFIEGNEVMTKRYNGRFPWKKI